MRKFLERTMVPVLGLLGSPAGWALVVTFAALLAGFFIPITARSDTDGKVTIDNFTFTPPVMTISKGSEVTWTNNDDIPHSIVLGEIGVHSKALNTGNTFTYRFDKTGTFSYICGLHPHMHAQVVVK